MITTGKLYLVATPIGNLGDITIRAIKTLLTVDYIACEDTRKTGQLIKHLKDSYSSKLDLKAGETKFISFYDEVESRKTFEIMAILKQGKNVALVSDSGTPLIADPGFRLIDACIKYQIPVVSIPGPTAFVTALVTSGLPTNNVQFTGFLPYKKVQKEKLFKSLKQKTTIVCYESPYRLAETLETIKQVFGDINIVVSRELTKIYEETFRGKVSEALIKFTNPKGEFVILFNTLQALRYRQQEDLILSL